MSPSKNIMPGQDRASCPPSTSCQSNIEQSSTEYIMLGQYRAVTYRACHAIAIYRSRPSRTSCKSNKSSRPASTSCQNNIEQSSTEYIMLGKYRAVAHRAHHAKAIQSKRLPSQSCQSNIEQSFTEQHMPGQYRAVAHRAHQARAI